MMERVLVHRRVGGPLGEVVSVDVVRIRNVLRRDVIAPS
jgi:hypothetical protein